MSIKRNTDMKFDIYTEYYRITGMWWIKIYNMLDPLRERWNRRREMKEQNRVNHRWDRLIVDDYIKISYDAGKYQLHKNARRLKRLIYDHLIIFDFISAFEYMDEYIRSGYRNHKKYRRMRKKLEVLLDRIKEGLAQREDVIVFWTDCVSYYELEWLPKLNEKGKNSLFFEYAYTPVPYTRPSMCAMANKWMDIDDFGKDSKRNLNYHNSLLLHKVRQYGYEAKYFGHGKGPCVFDQSIQYVNSRARTSSCRTCFNAVDQLLNSEKKQFVIIHTLLETHPPYWYPDKEGKIPYMFMDYERGGLRRKAGREYRQIRNAAEYWDKQLDFYSGLFGELSSKIYMSDHGKEYRQHHYKEWAEETNRIIFFMKSKYAKARREERLFTLENFSDLIEAVMKAHRSGKEIDLGNVFQNPFMRMQKIDTYNKELVNHLKTMHCEEAGHAYRGIRTKEDCYIRFRNRECYYRNGDEGNNLIDSPECAERVAELRKLAGDGFIDINKNDKFRYARELYR